MCLDYLVKSIEPVDIGYQVKQYTGKGKFKSLYFDDLKNIKVGLIINRTTTYFKIGKVYKIPTGMKLLRTNSMFGMVSEKYSNIYHDIYHDIYSGYYAPGFHMFHELSAARGFEEFSWKKRIHQTAIIEVEARGERQVGVQHHSLVTVAQEIKLIRIVPDGEH